MANDIIARAEKLRDITEEELLKQGREIHWQAKSAKDLTEILPDAFALAREASRRVLGMEQYPVQIMGACALFEGHIAEMQTGEGKTLTAVMPSYLRALRGRGVHVITVNDYLAQRDADQMGPVYKALGLTVSCVTAEMEPEERRAAYACDITYCTAKELGFDFLRDRLRSGTDAHGTNIEKKARSLFNKHDDGQVQRGHYFALIDEADSILIDEARTPLIIGLLKSNDSSAVTLMRWSQRICKNLKPVEDYIFDPERRSAYLTDAGCRHLMLIKKPTILDKVETQKIYTQVERALIAQYGFQRDRDYVVADDKVHIVDESTGRIMEGRKWQDGLHQAIEAKEMVPITAATGQAARITVQEFFRHYTHLSGMTGTAQTARRELKKTFHLKVAVIPTNKRCIRKGLPTRLFPTLKAKWEAVASEIERMREMNRAVLLGTPSVEASEAVSQLLLVRGVPHQVLNAHYHEQEAEIVKEAGHAKRVTIATNMAGRGTDILLDETVRGAGGLHVIATEMHTSDRIDRQLLGRAARQGDPGSYQFFLSWEDELFRSLSSTEQERLKRKAEKSSKAELSAHMHRLFKAAQRKIQKAHRKNRKQLLKHEQQRNRMYLQMGIDPYLELTE
ncbi:preprotein translocase subunit SecA [Polystyrenella longa]|uniref:Protein translocase subunit SecA n=2 Tax=Polystyrenella longa TaxID=2528007 RepID=A0A518CSB9_9PLAN|nr:preprotein translocase subunit SecA [Polystyrenella longa]